MNISERVAVAENDIKYVKKTVDRINTNVELLVAERNQGIGKRAVLSFIYGIIGGLVVAVIEHFK